MASLTLEFHNRAAELEAIRRAVASDRPEMAIVYGRRGSGKTRLLAEALTGQRVFWYEATLRVISDQLEDLTAALRSYARGSIIGKLESVRQALDALADLAEASPDRPAVWVIDELPWLDEAAPGVATVIKEWWDRRVRDRLGNAKLFLAGSVESWMRAHTMAESGALHNRRTRQLHVGPLAYADAALFYPRYGSERRIETYAVFGGLPSYLAEIRPGKDLWDNVLSLMLDPTARLAEEPDWFRYGDLRGDAIYASVLRAIASGARQPSDIARAVGRNGASEIIFQLDRLREIGLVERDVPITERNAPRSRRSLYRVADPYVAFWYRFVDRQRHLVAARRGDRALDEIKRTFDHYVSYPVFEDVCRQFIAQADETRLPGPLIGGVVGSWWTGRASVASGDDSGIAPSDQLDLVVMHEGRTTMVGECKWSSSVVDMRDLAGLDAALERGRAELNPIDRPWRTLFARRGFHVRLKQLASDPAERILLYAPENLYTR